MRTSPTHLSGKLTEIQLLRAFAVFLVALAHSSSQINAPQLFRPELGHFGVDIFFIISGFIMVLTTEKKKQGAISFFLDRLTRIVPVYWFYSFVLLAVSIIAPSALRGTEFSLGHLILSLGFIPHVNPATESFSPFLRLGWTLNMEMMFYCVFSLAMFTHFQKRVTIASTTLAVLVILGYGSTAINVDLWGPIEFWSSDLVLEFIMGMGLGILYVRKRIPQIKMSVAAGIFIFGLCLAYYFSDAAIESQFRGIFWGIPAAMIVLSVLITTRQEPVTLISRTFAGVGNASFTIYLSHIFFFSILRLIWQSLKLPQGTLLAQISFQFLAIILAFTCGYLAYKIVEVPLTNAVRRQIGVSQ